MRLASKLGFFFLHRFKDSFVGVWWLVVVNRPPQIEHIYQGFPSSRDLAKSHFFSSSRFLIDDSRLNGTRAKQSMLEFHPPRNVIYENQMLRIPWVAFRTEKIGCELSRISPRKIHYRTSRAQVDLAMNQREINNATHRGMKSLFFSLLIHCGLVWF